MSCPKSGPLQLIIITCKTHLHCNLNLELLAKCLPIDERILGKKLINVIAEGAIKIKKRKSKPLSNNKRPDFSNQCTIVVNIDDNHNNINLKIFGNGKIVITGGLSIDDCVCAVNIFRQKIANLTKVYNISPLSILPNVFLYIKNISKNYLIFLKLFTLFGLDIDLHLDTILNKKLVNQYKYDNNGPVDNTLLTCKTDQDRVGFIKIIEIYNIIHMYYTNAQLISKLEQNDIFTLNIIKELYSGHTQTLPVTFDKVEMFEPFTVTVENYNTMFDSGFHINRCQLTHILNDIYKPLGIITSAKFEPSNYQGVNAKYISRSDCRSDCDSSGKKKHNKCKCKEISFLIFQEGNIIITGGRSWEQISDGYNVITNILNKEYAEIVVDQNANQENTDTLNQPPQLTRIDEYGQKIIFINKKSQILGNPRNMYLLKNIGLMDQYI